MMAAADTENMIEEGNGYDDDENEDVEQSTNHSGENAVNNMMFDIQPSSEIRRQQPTAAAMVARRKPASMKAGSRRTNNNGGGAVAAANRSHFSNAQ
mmetsp:Transcript_117912/g.165763  ORF Transcript_117912/g.165763 Transcript_117912/m.165763 type:complete len:97 (+) Transcript_117912:332-622(+)